MNMSHTVQPAKAEGFLGNQDFPSPKSSDSPQDSSLMDHIQLLPT